MEPEEITKKLGEWIVGQDHAKRSVAVAMRNRWRRKSVPEILRKEIIPKNILMIGPTGSGKTEVARRMAELSGAPFIKVEATKFTEVGFKGADVDSIIKDLFEIALKQVTTREENKHSEEIRLKTEEVLLNLLLGPPVWDQRNSSFREEIRKNLRNSVLDNIELNYDMKPMPQQKDSAGRKGPQNGSPSRPDPSMVFNFLALNTMPQHPKKGKHKISEIRRAEESWNKNELVNHQKILQTALHETEEYGIVFLDEIDKIVSSSKRNSDVSDEGVQRDLLPLIEGCKIATERGVEVDTSKILFIAAGAFSQSKPSDLLPELQGRLPVRVVLSELSADDLYRIMTEPVAHMVRQQKALLKTEGVDLRITDDAIRELANLAIEVNRTVENIGARRLHTVTETLFEDLSFNAPDYEGQTIVFDKSDVEAIVERMKTKSPDLKQYIL